VDFCGYDVGIYGDESSSMVIFGQQVTFDCQRVCPLVNIPKSYRTHHIEWQKATWFPVIFVPSKNPMIDLEISICGGQARPRGPGGSMKYQFLYSKVRIFKCSYRTKKTTGWDPEHSV